MLHSAHREGRRTSRRSTTGFLLMACPRRTSRLRACMVSVSFSADNRPNFLLVMCDDMDLLLGGVQATPQVERLLGGGGATANAYFVSSPKCTPSRSAWLSGRHYHNLRPHGAKSGRGLNTSAFFDEDAIFPKLQRAGYQTGIFGKIHNNQGSWLCKEDNHTEPFDHIGNHYE